LSSGKGGGSLAGVNWLVKVTDQSTGKTRYKRQTDTVAIDETLNDINTFSFTLRNTTSTDRTNFDISDEIDIEREGTSVFLGIIENIKYRTNGDMIITGRDFSTKMLKKLMGNEMEFINKNNDDVLTGWAGDQSITQPNASSTHITFDSDSADDIQKVTVRGLASVSGHRFYRKEDLILTGTTAINTTYDFTEIHSITLESAANGTITVVDSLSNAVCTFSATETTAVAQDSDSNYGNGILYGTGIAAGTINSFSGNPITIRFDWDNRLRAGVTVANICDQDWWVDSDKKWQQRDQRGETSPVLTLKDGINIISMEREKDAKEMFNRLVFIGKAEGINQTYSGREDTTSQGTYGVMEGKIEDRRVTTTGTADDLLTGSIAVQKDPVEIYSLVPKPKTGYALGDVIRVIDDKVGLNSTYRIKKIRRTSTSVGGEIVTLNVNQVKKDLNNDLINLVAQANITNTSPQGAVNLIAISEKENCDEVDAPDHYLNMSFYMPPDAKAINRIKLSFKLTDFWYYTTTTPSGGSVTSGTNSDSTIVTASQQVKTAANATATFTDYTMAYSQVNDGEETHVNIVIVEGSSALTDWYARVYDGTNYYPDSTGIRIGVSPRLVTEFESSHTHSHSHEPSSGDAFASTSGAGFKLHNVTGSPVEDLSGCNDADTANHTHAPKVANRNFVAHDTGESMYNAGSTDTDASTPSAHFHNEIDGGFYFGLIKVPGNMNGKTLTVQIKHNDTGFTHSALGRAHYTVFSKHTHTTGDHTHAMSPGINTETLASPSITLYAGDESSETLVGTYTTDQTNLDLTSHFGTSSGWKNFQFRPNKRMRIEANAYAQIYLESR